MECGFGRWYLAEEECINVAVTVRREADGILCGEAEREALALALEGTVQRDDCDDNITKERKKSSIHLQC